jgi:hypothetical protein
VPVISRSYSFRQRFSGACQLETHPSSACRHTWYSAPLSRCHNCLIHSLIHIAAWVFLLIFPGPSISVNYIGCLKHPFEFAGWCGTQWLSPVQSEDRSQYTRLIPAQKYSLSHCRQVVPIRTIDDCIRSESGLGEKHKKEKRKTRHFYFCFHLFAPS